MRDLGLALMLAVLCAGAVWRAWVGVVALAFVAFLQPQGYAEGFLRGAPAFLLVFAATVLGAVKAAVVERWRPTWQFDWRLPVLAALWAWFAVTSWASINPWAAWPKFFEMLKLLPPLVLLLLFVDSRGKLQALIAATALSIGLVAVKGGYWALMMGLRERVYGPPGSAYAGNNEFAVAAVIALPLLLAWRQHVAQRWARAGLAAVAACAVIAALSSWSRGGLLSLTAVALLLVWNSRRRWTGLAAVLVAGVAAAVAVPGAWIDRMTTIFRFEGDESALGRLEVWRKGLALALDRPVVGGGFEGWIYATFGERGPRDWHSAYVEMLAEHGWIGLGLWLAVVCGSLVALTRLAHRARRRGDGWTVSHAQALRAALVGYSIGAAFLGIAYWELLYWLIAMAIALQSLGAAGVGKDYKATSV